MLAELVLDADGRVGFGSVIRTSGKPAAKMLEEARTSGLPVDRGRRTFKSPPDPFLRPAREIECRSCDLSVRVNMKRLARKVRRVLDEGGGPLVITGDGSIAPEPGWHSAAKPERARPSAP